MTAAEDYARRIVEQLGCGTNGCPCHQAMRRGHGLTHCFVHQDPGPSLSISVKSDKLLVNCQAGCDQRSIIAGLRQNDLWLEDPEHERRPSGKATIAATYDYTDEHGKLLYQVVRYFPKGFKQRRPDDNGGWLWNLQGTRLVPYRLPDLIASGDRIVFVVEGEKDVDRLYSAGFVATTGAMGAGKWRDQYAQHLIARRVILVPDNDATGREHDHAVARSLKDHAASVQWLELPGLPEKGDISDWFDAGGTPEQLKELVKAATAPPAEPPRRRVFEREGLGYRYEPLEAPIIVRFSHVVDKHDDTNAEIKIVGRDNRTIVSPRRVNLLGASGVPPALIKQLERAKLPVDENLWDGIIGEGIEAVLDAHRNGLVVEHIRGDIKRPEPPAWFCDGLVMRGKVNVWLAAAGTGKSTAAKILAVHAAAGLNFLGRFTEHATTLYLDWEDDREDLERVAHDVCREMGVWPVPDIMWISMRGKRLRDSVERLIQLIEENDVGLVVVDAIAAAGGSGGERRSYEDIALELEACFGQIPHITVLGLDHVTSEEHKNGKASVPTKARGAERKVEYTRNQWTLMIDQERRDEGDHIVTWYHTKINAGRFRKPFTTEFVHGDGTLALVERDQVVSPETVERLNWQQRTVLFVKENPGSTAEAVCIGTRGDRSQGHRDSTGKELNRARAKGLLEKDVSGSWWPSGHPDMPRQLSGMLSGEIGADLP